MVVGSGLLGLPGIALEEGGVHSAALGWVLTSAAMAPLVYVFATLGRRFTSAAGLSRYVQEGIGDWAGDAVTFVLCGSFAIGIPGLALIGGAYGRELLDSGETSVWVFALAILGGMTALNLLGVRTAGTVNVAAIVALVGLVVVIVLARIGDFGTGVGVLADTVTGEASVNYADVWLVSALLVWVFIGWENLSFGLEEFVDPDRNIPRVYWLSYVLVVAVYLALAFTAIGASEAGLGVGGAAGVTALVQDFFFESVIVTVMVLIIVANASAWVFGASRLIYAAGREGILPRYLGTLDKSGVPWASLVSLFALYAILTLASGLGWLSLSTIILLIGQNFILLYLLTIFAYWKIESGWRRWVVTAAVLVSCGFLLSGFGILALYSVSLFTLGYLRYRWRTRQPAAIAQQ
jgi:amino acid transporter